MEWINFRHLYAFWSVCRYGGFLKAAEKVHVSQSAISDQVSQLESYLEQTLIERSTRSFKVTPEGAELLKYAETIFKVSTEINETFKGQNSLKPKKKSLKVGMVGGVSRNLVYDLIKQTFFEENQLSFHVIDGSFDELNKLLKAFDLDLVLSLEVPRKKDLTYLSYKKVESSALCLAAKPEVIKSMKSKRAKPKDIEVYVFDHYYEDEVVENYIQSTYNVNMSSVLRSDDISLLRFMAHSGRGVAIVPEIGVHEDLQNSTLSKLRVPAAPSVDFYAVYLTEGFKRSVVDSFIS